MSRFGEDKGVYYDGSGRVYLREAAGQRLEPNQSNAKNVARLPSAVIHEMASHGHFINACHANNREFTIGELL